jgi:methyl-accepting chemotaxis protein
MFSRSNSVAQAALAQVAAISKSQAVIEFNPDGTIVTANENFLKTLGYSLGEIQGKHHSMFVEPAMRDSAAYREFWAKLNRGEFQAAQYKRIGKGGKEVWIQASYNPMLDRNGKVYKVIKFATDITAEKLASMENAGMIAAIGRAQAVIAFNLDGMVITANENFLKTLGYSLGEIQGKHHSMFVEPATRDNAAYREFWASLNRGEYQSAEYKRIGKGGKEVWILASYNPILDEKGKPFKVVKFATDVTEQKLRTADLAGQIAAIGKSQAVIEFNMDGSILTANENFLNALGYSLREIQGKHHSLFIDAADRDSAAYREFWANLNAGKYQAGEFKRIGKGGREI